MHSCVGSISFKSVYNKFTFKSYASFAECNQCALNVHWGLNIFLEYDTLFQKRQSSISIGDISHGTYA